MKFLKENVSIKDVSYTTNTNGDLKLFEFDLSIKLFDGVWTDNIIRIWAKDKEEALENLWKRTLPNSITVEFNRKKTLYDKIRYFFLGTVSYVENKTYKQDINNKIRPFVLQRLSDMWKWIKKNW